MPIFISGNVAVYRYIVLVLMYRKDAIYILP